ncbi:MAG: hypothetical protein LKF36_14555 [Lactobacillus sp.]|jgi:preprotein translocase subunit SecY|nr:hypothetical protein [Lactobacillus sp.]
MDVNVNSTSYKDLAKKIGISLALAVVFLLAQNVITPFLNVDLIEKMKGMGLLENLDLVSGGAIAKFSIVSIGVTPFIMAQIVVQILQTQVSPTFTEWAKQGNLGQLRLKKATYVISIPFALFYSWGVLQWINTLSSNKLPLFTDKHWYVYASVVAIWSGSSLLLSYVADKTSTVGIANGVSLIIALGILNKVPEMVKRH